MQSKDCSRAFYPYQPMDLEQQARNIEKLKSSTANLSDDVLDRVDDTIDFLNKFLENSDEVQREIASGKYLSASLVKGTNAQTHMYQEFKTSLGLKSSKEDMYDPQYGVVQGNAASKERSNKDNQHQSDDRHKKAMLQEMGISEDGT